MKYRFATEFDEGVFFSLRTLRLPPEETVIYRGVKPESSTGNGVAPTDEEEGVRRLLIRHGYKVSKKRVSHLVQGHYAYLYHRGILRPDWGHGFPDKHPLLDASGAQVPAEWVELARGDAPIWEHLTSLAAEWKRALHRRKQGTYERVYLDDDDGLAVLVGGDLPYSEPEDLLGVYKVSPEDLAGRDMGEELIAEESPMVGLDEVPWIIDHWKEFGEGRPPDPRLVAAMAEAQYRYLCQEEIVDDDPDGWDETSQEELDEAMAAYRRTTGTETRKGG